MENKAQRRGRYQNSYCKNHYLHDYRQVDTSKNGIVERCTRCGKTMNFPNNIPNHIFLSHHLRAALQVDDPRFLREYPHALKN